MPARPRSVQRRCALRPRAMIAAAGMPDRRDDEEPADHRVPWRGPLRVAREPNPQVVMNCPEHTERNANEHKKASDHGNARFDTLNARIKHCEHRALQLVCARQTGGNEMPRRSDLQEVVQQFVDKLSSLIEPEAVSRAREAALPRARRTRLGHRFVAAVVIRKRRKGPIQLCPVPGCSNRAAPVFGMVCSKHKDLPKATIKKYREARRAKKAKKAK